MTREAPRLVIKAALKGYRIVPEWRCRAMWTAGSLQEAIDKAAPVAEEMGVELAVESRHEGDLTGPVDVRKGNGLKGRKR